MMAAGMLVATSCSDFNDYNEVTLDKSVSGGNQTLWENISQNAQLTDFASLVKRVGFDTELSNTRYYTVWAPLNGTFNKSEFDALSDSLLLAQFVKSHVAEFGHAASGDLDERVHTLNEKSFVFAGNGEYTYDGKTIDNGNINLPSTNGLLHLLNGAAKFYPNLYEYIFMGQDIDSVRQHFQRYQQTLLDVDASVKGPMVNGVQTYVDSVMVTRNSMLNQLNANLTNEDSSYTFLMPTNKAFASTYDRIRKLYNFIATTAALDVMNFAKAGDTKQVSLTVDPEYMADSLTRRAIFRNLVYSNNDEYNKWVVGDGLFTDTLRSTTRSKFSNPKDITEKYMVGEPEKVSNGFVRLVDSLAFYPWETFNPELSINPNIYLANLFPNTAQARPISLPDTLVEKMFGERYKRTSNRGSRSFLWIDPGGERAKPDFCIMLPSVLSTTYNFYVVFLPTTLRQLGNETRPNKLNFELSYCGDNGKLATYKFSKAYADSLLSGGELPKVATKLDMNTAFENNPEKLDSVFIGQFTFPVAYNGLNDNTVSIVPSIRVTSPISVFNNQQLSSYSRDVRIAAIVMRPVELDEFEANNK